MDRAVWLVLLNMSFSTDLHGFYFPHPLSTYSHAGVLLPCRYFSIMQVYSSRLGVFSLCWYSPLMLVCVFLSCLCLLLVLVSSCRASASSAEHRLGVSFVRNIPGSGMSCFYIVSSCLLCCLCDY